MAPPPALPPTIRLEGSEDVGLTTTAAAGRRGGGSRPVSIQFGSSLDSDYCKALYDYGANGSDELSLHEDDIIHILSRCPNGVEDGWWLGELGGRSGLFPSIVVEECQANGDDWSPDVSLASPTASIAPPSFSPPPLDLPPLPPPPPAAAAMPPSLPLLPGKPPPPPAMAPPSKPVPAAPNPLTAAPTLPSGVAGLQLPHTKITITNPTPVIEDVSEEREEEPVCYTVEDTNFSMSMSSDKIEKYKSSSNNSAASSVVIAEEEMSSAVIVQIIEPEEAAIEPEVTINGNDAAEGDDSCLMFTEIVVTAPTPRNQSPDEEEHIRFEEKEAESRQQQQQQDLTESESEAAAAVDDDKTAWGEDTDGGADTADWASFQVGRFLSKTKNYVDEVCF